VQPRARPAPDPQMAPAAQATGKRLAGVGGGALGLQVRY
jgi:hypothetical protein